MRGRILLLGLVGTLGLPWTEAAPAPGACQGCHTMDPAVASWRSGNHAKAAACEDCHLPGGSRLRRAAAQASQGVRHLAASLFDPDPAGLRLQAPGAAHLQANCLRCHPLGAEKKAGRPAPTPRSSVHLDPGRPCLDCHRETSHRRSAGW